MRIGFIGLGIMGRPMAMNLIKAGHELVVCDHKRAAADELVAHGAVFAENGAEIASSCDLCITMVQNSPQVREAVLGRGGLAETAKPGFTLIDMSSIDPVESKRIGAELEKRGCDMLDAPVSGGEPKAIDGTLSVMAGGKRETFDRFLPILSAMASSVTYIGPLGAGNIAKLANQMVVACNIAAVAEALSFSRKAGADPELVYQAIRGGLAGSTVMDAKAPMMLRGEYKPGFRIELHIKDLSNALSAAHAVNSPAPLTGEVMEMMQSLSAHGFAREDHSALARFYEMIGGTEIGGGNEN